MIGEIHTYDVGDVLLITVKNNNDVVQDLSSVTTKDIKFLKPNKDSFTRTVSFVTDGTDGRIQYAFQGGDLDIRGIWRYQLIFVIGTNIYYSDITSFKVFPNI